MAFVCNRWDRAMRICIGGDPSEPQRGRWKGDPIALNDEAFFLSPENQCKALDFMEEASPEIRSMMLPIWKYCFAQWIIYDAGMEAQTRNAAVSKVLNTAEMMQDIVSLTAFCESGGLEKAQKSEKWSWKMLEKMPVAGTAEWGDDNSPMVQAAREERSEGVEAWNGERYEKAFWHFNQGIRLLARLPEPLTPVQCKLGCDLFKNVAAAALQLNMNRIALNVADAAINLFPDDQKAWFRKARALQNLDLDKEATQAFLYAGYAEVEKQLGPASEPPPEGSAIDQAMQEAIDKLVFVDCGITSLDAIELLALLQDKFAARKLPAGLIFSYPSVGEAAAYIAESAPSQGEPTTKAASEIIYRAMCQVLGRDPLKIKLSPSLMSEERALGGLLTLLESYQSPEYVTKAAEIARNADYEHKPFLSMLKKHALVAQVQTLEMRGFPTNAEGMRKFEGACVACAAKSKQVKELLQTVRHACYGGQDGMWPLVMDDASSGARRMSRRTRGSPIRNKGSRIRTDSKESNN